MADSRLENLSESKRALLEKLIVERRAASLAIRPRPRPERVPLSFGQERLWIVERLAPGSAAYNEPMVMWLDGPLDTAALDRAIHEVIRRHEALRTSIPSSNGQPQQRISADAELPMESIDLSSLPEADARDEALKLARRAAAASFDLERGPLVRALRVRVAPERHLIALVVHHILIDGWSIGVVLAEIANLYNGATLGDVQLQYADFAMWQREWLAGERMEKQLAYWRETLDGCPSAVDLPSDRPRPPVQSFRGSVVRRMIPEELYEAVELFSRRENATPFMTLFAAWVATLHRWTGQLDLPVGVGLANRPRAELESVVGFFVNTLVFRTRFDSDPSFRDLLGRVRETTLGAQANQDAPLSRVVEALKLPRAASHMPFVQVMTFFQNYAQDVPPMRDLQLARVPLDVVHPGSAQTDIALFMNQDATGELLFQYSTDLFDEETIDRLAGNFLTLLRAAIDDPARDVATLPILTPKELAQLELWNDTRLPYPGDRPLVDRFFAQAAKTPDAPAVTFRGRTMTYGELQTRATLLAHELRARGVRRGDLVGLYVDRSIEMLVGLYAILAAGAAYVPLDPAYPADRLAFMLEDAGAKVVVTQETLRESVPSATAARVIADATTPLPDAVPALEDPHVAPSDLAYVIFTSGSTGRPKGVQITQRAAVNLLTSVAREPGMTVADTICAVSTLSFDIALFELVLPLTVGAHILLADRDTARDGAALAKLVDAHDVTVMQATPATWRMLLDLGWRGKPGIKLITTGEACPRELADRLLPVCRELWNLYGPTETTVYSALGRIERGTGPISIGRPVANTQIHIVDRNFQRLPVGVPGELLIGGDGLARGYLGRPDLTAEKFIADPFAPTADARVYRAGDLAMWKRDGTLEVLGRLDHQVKLRGFRIELGEIETVLAAHPGVEQAVVHCREDRPGDKRLVAYVKGSASIDELRAHLRQSLPDYMIPSAFVVLAAFPLTPNGKVDRKQLPAPESLQEATVSAAPRTADEQRIAALWTEILGRPHIGRDDNFFDHGGHSLLATQLMARMETAFGVEVPLRVLFETPTVAALASFVADAKADALAGEDLDELLSQIEELSEEEAARAGQSHV